MLSLAPDNDAVFPFLDNEDIDQVRLLGAKASVSLTSVIAPAMVKSCLEIFLSIKIS
jgi:hypothetical protein